MLGFFANRSAHPLADTRTAKTTFAELTTRDPVHALEEATAWLESLVGADDLKPAVRLERVLQLDDTVAAQARRLGREFIHHGRTNRMQEARLWEINHGYWRHLVAAYGDCLARYRLPEKDAEAMRPQLPLLYARAIHAHAVQMKWSQFRYGPIVAEAWEHIGAIYLAAEAEKVAQRPMPLYTGLPPTTVEAEYLKALLFHASSMDKLVPLEIELAERLIVHALPRFALTREVRPENVYWVDAARPLPPTRLAKVPAITPSLRFFNGGDALGELERIRVRTVAEGRVPAEVNLGGQYEMADVLSVLDHLAMCWAPKPPMRNHARHRVKSRLMVAHGFASIQRYISGASADPGGVEVWVVEDVSLGGMGAQVPISRQDWIRIGVLVAMQPDGGANWLVGIVRRFARIGNSEGQVGIETLSKTPWVVAFEGDGFAADGILLDLPVVGEHARMLIPPGGVEEKSPVIFDLDGKRARLHPVKRLHAGDDYLLVDFFVQSFH